MVFKLVQVDSENPSKIQLNPGIHVFGRAKLLHVNDKRISKVHGQFEITDDSLTIKALHQNPCFYQKNGSTKAEILRLNDSVSLSHGDKFGLLPTSCWYEVLYCVPVDDGEIKGTQNECEQNANDGTAVDSGEETDDEGQPTHNPLSVSNGSNQESQATEVLSPCESDSKLETDGNAHTTEKNSVSCSQTPDSDKDNTEISEPVSPSLSNQKIEKPSVEAGSSTSEQDNAAVKRSHSAGEEEPRDEVKKIKVELDVKPDIKVDPDGTQAGPSSNSNNGDGVKAAGANLRERCMYGASCYRRNPAHLAQFSHPRDADWGAGAQAPCPWGAACGKRDPRHWRDHSHPPDKQPPPPPGTRVVHRQGNVFYINAHTVNFHDDHFEAEDSDGNSVDYDYEFD